MKAELSFIFEVISMRTVHMRAADALNAGLISRERYQKLVKEFGLEAARSMRVPVELPETE